MTTKKLTVEKQEIKNSSYTNLYTYELDTIDLDEKLKHLNIFQLAGLFGFETTDNYLQGVTLNPDFLVWKTPSKTPLQYIFVNGKKYPLQDRQNYNIVLHKDFKKFSFSTMYFGNRKFNNGQFLAIKKIFEKRRKTMNEFKKQKEILVLNYMNADGNYEGFKIEKKYEFDGCLINSWTEKKSVSTSISYRLFQKSDDSFILFIEENNRNSGQGGEGWLKIFKNKNELREYCEAMYCMAGYCIQL